jgi:protein-tyrosine phosphatase
MDTANSETDVRKLSLAGVWNVRDLGGLVTVDGKRVRRGLVFRAAALDHATDDDVAILATLGLNRIFDLRADRERSHTRPAWQDATRVRIWKRNYAGNAGDLLARLREAGDGDPDLHGAMMDAYRRIAREQAPAIAAIFTALAQGEAPLLFHCAVGKDRTGAVAALLLAVLGVSFDEVIADYLLTNDSAGLIRMRLLQHPFLRDLDATRDAIWSPLAIAHPDYLRTLFETVIAEGGSIDAFLAQTAGVTPETLESLRTRLLE